jgi:predicted dehydrogenase
MLKVGVVGDSHTLPDHLQAIQQLPGLQLTGLFASPTPAVRNTCQKLNLHFFEDFSHLLAHSDVIDFVTPLPDYYPLAVKAVKKSKSLFLRQAVFSSPEEVLQLSELASEADVCVQTYYPLRFHPVYTASHRLLSHPKYMEAQYHLAFSHKGQTVSVVNDLMMPDIDMVQSLAKANIRSVHASGVAVFNGTPDLVHAHLEFDNGVAATLTASRISVKDMHIVKFYQSRLRVQSDFLKSQVKELIKPGTEKASRFPVKGKKVPESTYLLPALSDFYQAVIRHQSPSVTLDQVYQNLKTAFLINEKIKVQGY